MKKLFAVCCAVVLAFGLAACSSGGSGAGSSSGGTAGSAAKMDESITETVIYNEGGIVVTAKSFSKSGSVGPELKLLVENNSDINRTVQVRKVSINGIMVDTMCSIDAAAGKKANGAVSFSRSDLKDSGIETVKDMQMSLHIFDTNTFTDSIDTDIITIPTAVGDSFEQTVDESGNVLYDADGVRIINKGISDGSSAMGPQLNVLVENNSGRDIVVQTRNVSVNGFTIDAGFSPEIVNGKVDFASITLFGNQLKENDISKVESVELSFAIIDANNFADTQLTDPIVVNA